MTRQLQLPRILSSDSSPSCLYKEEVVQLKDTHWKTIHSTCTLHYRYLFKGLLYFVMKCEKQHVPLWSSKENGLGWVERIHKAKERWVNNTCCSTHHSSISKLDLWLDENHHANWGKSTEFWVHPQEIGCKNLQTWLVMCSQFRDPLFLRFSHKAVLIRVIRSTIN